MAVRDEFPEATLIRPAVMFGTDDAFLSPIIKLLRRMPIYPTFGRGETRLQPAFVEDVAEAVAVVTRHPDADERTFECAGPRVYTYAQLVKIISDALHLRRPLIPMPFVTWYMLAGLAEWLPVTPITRNQVELMRQDNVAAQHAAGFAELGIMPRPLEEVLPTILCNS